MPIGVSGKNAASNRYWAIFRNAIQRNGGRFSDGFKTQ